MTVDATTGQPPGIVYEDVYKAFGSFEVLRGLNLVVPRGRITFLIGRSGTGKSVTLKHVLGLLRPDRGRVIVGDVDLGTLSERALRQVRNRFGMVFQHAALFDSMDVFDNVAFPLREHTKATVVQVANRVDELLAQVGLTGAEHKQVSELSGGMRKRVGLARALSRDPEFLLYDEPTTGLDPVLAAAMDQLILETQASRPALTSLIISHDMSAVFRIADKVAMLVDGRIHEEGTAEQFRNSGDPVTRQFVTGSLQGPMRV